MIRILIAIPLIIAAFYVAVMFLAWSFQDRLIFPASQEVVEPEEGYELILLNTADGLQLRAFYRMAAPGKPTVVYFHGNGGTLRGSMAANARFAEAGIGLLLVNYRGYGSNPGDPSEEGFFQDGRAAMAWLASEGISLSNTIIAGNSIGSGTAVQMASEYTPKALLLTAPFTSLLDIASEKAPWLPASLLLRHSFDNAAKLESLQVPVLIQHGAQDTLIPIHHGEALAGRAQQATFEPLLNVGHDLVFLPETQAMRLAWIEGLPS